MKTNRPAGTASSRRPVAAHRLHDDLVLDELDASLGQVADAGRGDHRILARCQQEHDDADQRRGTGDERDLVERREEVLPTQDRVDRIRELQTEHERSLAGQGRAGLSPGWASEMATYLSSQARSPSA